MAIDYRGVYIPITICIMHTHTYITCLKNFEDIFRLADNRRWTAVDLLAPPPAVESWVGEGEGSSDPIAPGQEPWMYRKGTELLDVELN
jgi:hypothetical protein